MSFASAAAIRGRIQAPSARTTGLILVGVVHLLMVGALVKGFQRHATEAPPPIQVKTVKDKEVDPPKPPEPMQVPPPVIPMPRQIEVPIPPVPITPAVDPVIQTTGITDGRTREDFAVTPGGKGEVAPPVAPPVKDVVKSVGAVCTQTASPEMPSVNWTGEALFRVVADVQGGRVVAVQIQTLSGAMDSRTRRAFSTAIEGTLKSRYVCPGEHRFQQDFAFRVD